MRRRVAALAACAAALAAPAAAAFELLVQPPAWRSPAARFDPGPFGELLARAAGQPVRVRTSDDALSHWLAVRSPDGYQFVLDEAHFTAFRVSRHGFRVLARAAGDVRFAVLARPGLLVAAPGDLAGRAVAVPAPPALAALRLLELFPGPVRAPRLLAVPTQDAALAALRAGGAAAAVLPLDDAGTAAGRPPALVTDASPGRGLSTGPQVDAAVRDAVLRALVAARASPAGRRALAGVGVTAFEPAADAAYEDSERLLRGTWGYR